jgi:hypothetical protein
LAGGGCFAAVARPLPLGTTVLERPRLLQQKPPMRRESHISRSATPLLHDLHPFSLLHHQLLCHRTFASQTTRAYFPTRTRTIARCPRRCRHLRGSAWKCFDLAFSALFVIWCCIRYPSPVTFASNTQCLYSSQSKSSLPKYLSYYAVMPVQSCESYV